MYKLDTPPEIKPLRKTSPAAMPTESTKRNSKQPVPSDDVVAREAQPTASGDRSLTRALGLKIGKIVIDPGHNLGRRRVIIVCIHDRLLDASAAYHDRLLSRFVFARGAVIRV